jgi:AAHS family 4-hydroxybenzoate transporter-like MFS transporter
MPAGRTVDVQALIDAAPLSRGQKWLILWCFLVVAIDGFDTALVGFIAPPIRGEWGLTPASLAPLFAAGLFGLMAGAFVAGPLADRYGRKAMLVACIAVFGVASLASVESPDLQTLIALRFLTGVGLGGAMPNAVTLTAEYCPSARRASLVTLMFCGFTLGSAVAGFVGAQVIPAFGWRAMLVIGGALPLALTPVLIIALPESVRYLVLRGEAASRVVSVLRRMLPSVDLADATLARPAAPAHSPIGQLFAFELRAGTILLWVAFFMSLLVVYLLSNWLPTLIIGAGFTLRQASLITAMFQVGGTLGAIAIGRWMDAREQHRVLGVSYALASVFVAGLGYAAGQSWLLVVLIFGAGFCVSGSQVGANALAAGFYPTASRATGVGWALAVGRLGSILGSFMGGAMLAQQWSLPTLYAVVALPPLVAAAALVKLGVMRAGRKRAET